MLVFKVLGLLLLHVALVTPGSQICHDPDENAYSIITCGAPGKDGLPGINGTDGEKGDRGEPGLPGPTGNPGEAGPRGEQGPPGPQGDRGDTGASGPSGPQGIDGPSGEKGERGDNGTPGTPGTPGVPGPAGPNGERGESGPSGPPGPKGERGDSMASAIEGLKLQVSALDGRLRDLQSIFGTVGKAIAFSKGIARSNNKIYIINGVEVNYFEAKTMCGNAGGQMASPRNNEENEAIFSIRRQVNQHAFMGITDLQTPRVFIYPSGEVISYSNWNPGEPNNRKGKERCVEIRENGKWNDENCSSRRLFVCEFLSG